MEDNNSSSMIVAIVAILVIVIIALFAWRAYNSQGTVTNGSSSSVPSVDINVGGSAGTTYP